MYKFWFANRLISLRFLIRIAGGEFVVVLRILDFKKDKLYIYIYKNSMY